MDTTPETTRRILTDLEAVLMAADFAGNCDTEQSAHRFEQAAYQAWESRSLAA